MHALASRICSMNEVLHLPPWMNSWMVSEASAAVSMPRSCWCRRITALSQSGTKLTQLALEQAGVPTLALDADMVNAKGWSHEQMVDYVSEFLCKAGLT